MTVTVAAATLLQHDPQPLIRPLLPPVLSSDGILGAIKARFSRESCCLVDFKAANPAFFEFGFLMACL